MADQIRPETKIAVTKEQVSCELGGEAVILQTGDGVYYGLNDVGNFAWQLIQKSPKTFGEIVQAVTAEFDVKPDVCEEDLARLFKEMATAKLLTITEAR